MIKVQFIKSNLVKYDDTILDVIKSLNKSIEKFCVVLNKKKKICGFITDGDLRRILLKEKNLKKTITKLFNKKFIFLKEGSQLSDAKKIFKKKKDIYYIPILKKNFTLKGIFRREDVFKKIEYLNEVLILAGGLGKRLHTLTDFFPKPMLSVGSRPLLESILYSLKSSGFKNINISVNYLQDKIKDYFGDGSNLNLDIKYFSEKKRLGTAGPLFFFKKKKIDKPIIVLNGDIYTNLKIEYLLNYHQKEKNDLTICCHLYSIKIPYGIIELYKRSKHIINEKPEINYLVNSGIYCIEPKNLKYLFNNRYQDMNYFINLLKQKKKKIGLFNIHENLYDIGDYSKLIEARESNLDQ